MKNDNDEVIGVIVLMVFVGVSIFLSIVMLYAIQDIDSRINVVHAMILEERSRVDCENKGGRYSEMTCTKDGEVYNRYQYFYESGKSGWNYIGSTVTDDLIK